MRDLSGRLLQFSIDVIKYQHIRSASSAGANYEEAQGAMSKADFNNKVHIALKEIRESNYWLKIITGILEKEDNLMKTLFDESEELKKILGSICTQTGKSLR